MWTGRARCPGAAARILRTLEAFGFEWDGEVLRQSDRSDHYAAALEDLRARGLTFECSCSRLDLADEGRYPGYCRGGPRDPSVATATRLQGRAAEHARSTDRIQGSYRRTWRRVLGDVILKRRDRFFAYLLAVVVDDAAQGVTHVVRGADLLDNTPRQIYLQRSLALPTPALCPRPGSGRTRRQRSSPNRRAASPRVSQDLKCSF